MNTKSNQKLKSVRAEPRSATDSSSRAASLVALHVAPGSLPWISRAHSLDLEDSDGLARAVETSFFKHVFTRYYSRSSGFSYWRVKNDREVDIIADMDGTLIPFEVKYRPQGLRSQSISVSIKNKWFFPNRFLFPFSFLIRVGLELSQKRSEKGFFITDMEPFDHRNGASHHKNGVNKEPFESGQPFHTGFC